MEGNLHLPFLRPPASSLLRVADHIPTLFKPWIEVEGNVIVIIAGLKIHSKPTWREIRQRMVSWFTAKDGNRKFSSF